MAGDVSLVFNLLSNDRVTPTIIKVTNNIRMANDAAAASAKKAGLAQQAAGLASQAGSLAAAAGTGIWVTSMASAASWAVAVGAAVSGSIGLVPAVVGAAAASFVGLKLATSGLGAAWQAMGKQSAAGGASAAQSARQVASAQREVTSAQEALAKAQRDALAAQKAISDAEESAAKNLRDMTLSLATAKLDEKSATLAVVDAQQQLVAAQQSGNAEEIAKANIAYQQSIISLQEAKNKTSDLTEENTKAQKAGVEGSDQVVQARQHQADATQAVTDATARLADAQANLKAAQQGAGGGAANAAAAALAKLAPSARAVVTTLHSLGSAWSGMRRQVQQATFAGVSGQIRALSDTYLPMLRARFTEMGGAFNKTITAFTGMARSKQFVADINTEIKNTTRAISVAGPALSVWVKAFNQIAGIASSFLPGMAKGFAGAADHFNAFITHARETGKLKEWIGTGVAALRDLGRIAGNVVKIVGDIFSAGGASSGKNFLATLATATGRLHAFLKTGQGRADIVNILAGLRSILGGLVGSLGGAGGALDKLKGTLNIAGTAMQFLAKHTGLLKALLPFLIVAFAGLKFAQPMLAAITVATKLWAAAQWLINIAMSDNPIGLIITAIGLLVAAIVWVATKTTWFQTIWAAIWDFLKGVGHWFAHDFVGYFKDAWHWIQDSATKAHDWIIGKLVNFVEFVNGIPGKFARLGGKLWGWVKEGLREAVNGVNTGLNWIIDQVNGLTGGLSKAWTWAGVPAIPKIPHAPMLAHLATGGIVKATPGGVPSLLAEGGHDEAVVPLPSGYRNDMWAGGGQQVIVLRVEGDGTAFGSALVEVIRRTVRVQGGNAKVLGIIQ